ncbi:tetratricopeptide repeat protein [Thermodesulfobacteriota bacterium]
MKKYLLPDETYGTRGNLTRGLPGAIPVFLLLGIIIFSIYSNTLESPFIFDDYLHIEGNRHIRLKTLSLDSVVEAGWESPLGGRPVANISFALNYYFHGYRVPGYHLVNIAIHLATAFLLYLLLTNTLLTPALNAAARPHVWLPFVTALIWAVNPLHTQSVTYIVQRMNSLAALFYVGSLLCYVKARLGARDHTILFWYAGCLVSGVLAVFSKENAFALPFFIILYEWYFFQDMSRSFVKRYLAVGIGLAILSLMLMVLYVGGNPVQTILAGYEIRDFTPLARLLTEFRVVMYYVALLLLPHPSRLNLDHDFPVSTSLIDPLTTLASVGAVILVTVFAVLSGRRYRLLSFSLLWFLGNLVIESSVIGLEIIFEHRTYLPSMFFFVPLVWGWNLVAKPRKIGAVVLAIIVGTGMFWTYERNTIWKDEITLRLDCVQKSPNKSRAHAILANAYERQGMLHDARRTYQSALLLNPGNPEEIHFNLGNVLLGLGSMAEAEEQYRAARRLMPDNELVRLNLGVVLERRGKLAEAEKEYRQLIARHPDSFRAHNNLGNVLLNQGKVEEAIGQFMETLRLRPGFSMARKNLQRARELAHRARNREQTAIEGEGPIPAR